MGFELNLMYLFFFYPLLYMGIMYLTLPEKSINIKDMFKAIAMGYVSVTFLHFMYLIFPPMGEMISSAFARYFYVVAPREELAKFVAFLILIKYAIKKGRHPVAYMVYCGLVGLGFGIEENIIYYQRYGADVLYIRNFCSLLAHIFFGMFAGYFYGLGKLENGFNNLKTQLDNILKNKWPKLKLAFYSTIGLGAGILYHGLWNYNLHSSQWAAESIMILMIIVGLFTTFFMAKDLINGYKNKLNSEELLECENCGDTKTLKQQWLNGDGPQTD